MSPTSANAPVFELNVVKTGSKLQESTGPMAAALSRLLHRPITDRTELAGVYDVKLE